MQGKILDKRSYGSRRITWLDNLEAWYKYSSTELFPGGISKVHITFWMEKARKEKEEDTRTFAENVVINTYITYPHNDRRACNTKLMKFWCMLL